ncbi:hypothetical protein [uncultured Cohaesibacter sp.]|uniref:hypothetical protein n=1 Tax=uncultured Cohaesibacter sp. TaxID=1002546 RepID=UPI0029301731|nr:hypothetical protein [uncultured Cohaesibacter sp.]
MKRLLTFVLLLGTLLLSGCFLQAHKPLMDKAERITPLPDHFAAYMLEDDTGEVTKSDDGEPSLFVGERLESNLYRYELVSGDKDDIGDQNYVAFYAFPTLPDGILIEMMEQEDKDEVAYFAGRINADGLKYYMMNVSDQLQAEADRQGIDLKDDYVGSKKDLLAYISLWLKDESSAHFRSNSNEGASVMHILK